MVAGVDSLLSAVTRIACPLAGTLLLWGCVAASGHDNAAVGRTSKELLRSAEIGAADSLLRERDDSARRAPQDATNRSQPGYIVDSILPIEEASRRFRRGIGKPPRILRGGAASLDSLIAAFVGSVERRDSSALARLVIDRSEFAFLIYPHSPYTAPPYQQDPALVWSRIVWEGSSGSRRLWQRFGGRPLGYRGYLCPGPQEQQGPNRVWTGCRVILADSAGSRRVLRLFGPIVERGGRYKFVSLANDL